MIADFVVDRMSSYIAGGTEPKTAAHFTRGELLAIYKGNHYSRDASGAMRVTPAPEALDIEAATKKVNAAIREILKACADPPEEEKAPEAVNSGLEGFEELAHYGGDYWWNRY